jgi:hypothetical protein
LTRKGGRLGVEDPRRNIITFKTTDFEKEVLDMVSPIFESRSDMIRTLIFDFALGLDPEEVKDMFDPETLQRLQERITITNSESELVK